MPNDTLTMQQNAFKTPENTFDPAKFQGWMDQQAAGMGVKGSTTLPTGISSALTGPVGAGLKQQWETQQSVLEDQANKSKQAFQMQGQGFSSQMQGLDTAKKAAGGRNKQVDDSMQLSAQKAEQYVADAKGRASDMVSKLETLHTENMGKMDASKAHDMQANVQGFLMGMRDQEKGIVQEFGKDSPEYARYRETKMMGLGQVQSQIQGLYQKSLNEAGIGFETTMKDMMAVGNQYVGYNEQNHLEMLKANNNLAAAEAARRSEFDVTVAQLEGTAYENMANWVASSLAYSSDMTGQLSYLAAKEAANNAALSAERIAKINMGGGFIA